MVLLARRKSLLVGLYRVYIIILSLSLSSWLEKIIVRYTKAHPEKTKAGTTPRVPSPKTHDNENHGKVQSTKID